MIEFQAIAKVHVYSGNFSIGSMTGITTFIRDVLRGQTTFRVSHSGVGRYEPRSGGLKVGRETDHLFRRVVLKRERLDISLGGSHVRCRQVFLVLLEAGIRVVSVQDRGHMFGLSTSVDGVGIDGQGKRVIIELKSTGRTLCEHRILYDRVCSSRPVLSNGLVNSERNAHYLQAGFGCAAISGDYSVVVVSCRDGSTVYRVPKRFSESSLFLTSGVRSTTGKKSSRGRLSNISTRGVSSWPCGSSSFVLVKFLEKFGKIDRASGERLGLSCIIRGSIDRVICLRGRSTSCKSIDLLFERARKMMKCRTYICFPVGGVFRLREVHCNT